MFLEINSSGKVYSNFSNASITVDRVSGKFFEGRDIVRVIREHICNNTVKVSKL